MLREFARLAPCFGAEDLRPLIGRFGIPTFAQDLVLDHFTTTT